MVALALVAVTAMTSFSSSAGDFPKLVTGYVWDSAGTPLEGADVTINIKKPDESIRATETNQTDSNGQYVVTFSPEDWEVDDTVETISTYLGHQESNSTGPLTDDPIQWINVSYTFEIPEFGNTTGLMITGALLGAIAVIALVYFRKR